MSIFKRYCEQESKSRQSHLRESGNKNKETTQKGEKKDVYNNFLPSCTQVTLSTNEQYQAPKVDKGHKPLSTLSTFQNLPSICPIITGIVPDDCRFHPKLFNRMIAEGVISPKTGCPVYRACKIKKGVENE